MRISRVGISLFFLLAASCETAHACEPIVPLGVLFGGPSFLGILTSSLGGLFIVIGVKCLVFPLFEKRIPWQEAMIFMFLANLVSTFVGFLVSFPFWIPAGILVFVFIYPLCFFPAARIRTVFGWEDFSPWAVGSFLLFLFFLATGLYFLAHDALDSGLSFRYWLLKLGYVFVGFAVGMGLTTIYEEWIVSKLAADDEEGVHFMDSVFKANLVAFLVVAAIGAALVIPRRLASPGFLVRLQDVLDFVL